MRFLVSFATLFLTAAAVAAEPAEQLPGTEPLNLDEPLDVLMVRRISRHAERECERSPEIRHEKWNRDYGSVEAYQQSVQPNRDRLREIIGAVDERVKPRVLNGEPLPPELGVSGDSFRSLPASIHVAWHVSEGVTAEGLVTNVPSAPATAYAILVPDASYAPERMLAGNESDGTTLATDLAANGCTVLSLALIGRGDRLSGHPDVRETNLPHREFVYRMAFEMGRHIIGYEVQKVLAAVDLFEEKNALYGEEKPIIVAGVGEGGLIAFYAAALDPRIDACLVSGYFDEREELWAEPIYRNVWSLLAEFGDANIASLIAPRRLVIEAAAAPEVDGPPTAREGRSAFAAPGVIRTPSLAAVKREFAEAQEHYRKLEAESEIELVVSGDGNGPAGSPEALSALLKVKVKELADPPSPGGNAESQSIIDDYVVEQAEAREERQFNELVRHVQRLLHRSDKVRAKFWSKADASSVESWVASTQFYRDYVHDHMIGRLPQPNVPPNPRSRKVLDEADYVGYEVLLDVLREETGTDAPGSPDDSTIIAGGILLLPKDLKEGERRPVVVFQHGLEGTPMDTITEDESSRAWRAYKGVSAQLVRQGYIVYAPQNPYRGEHDFRVIQRKANPRGRSLFSYIIEQHRQTLRWLASLPYVDADRIGFYGLSYGGKTAVRVPPLLPPTEDEPGYALSICSADFNEWIRKNVSSEDRYSYVFTKEYEMFEWNMGHVAGYAELASLMVPRPFMVERGHDDGVAPDEWVAWEFAKVRRLYDRLGIGDRTTIEWFNGPHTINGVGTFEFLRKQLEDDIGATLHRSR